MTKVQIFEEWAYSPAALIDNKIEKIIDKIVKPTLKALKKQKIHIKALYRIDD